MTENYMVYGQRPVGTDPDGGVIGEPSDNADDVMQQQKERIMKKVFSFTQSLMNGTVTMNSEVALFATRELAEQTMDDIKVDNTKRDLGGMWIRYGEIQESCVYESKDEIPFYQTKQEKESRIEESSVYDGPGGVWDNR